MKQEERRGKGMGWKGTEENERMKGETKGKKGSGRERNG